MLLCTPRGSCRDRLSRYLDHPGDPLSPQIMTTSDFSRSCGEQQPHGLLYPMRLMSQPSIMTPYLGSPARILTSSTHNSPLSGPSVAYFREGAMGRPTISSRLYPTRNFHSCVPNREEFIWDTVIVQAVKSLIRGSSEQNTLLKKRTTWTEQQDLVLAGMGVLQFYFLVIYSLVPSQGWELSEEGVHFSWKPIFFFFQQNSIFYMQMYKI